MRLTIEWSRVRILLRPFGNFGNFLYPTLPVSFGRDTKSRWSLLSGVYARGSKRPHQSALEMCNCRGLHYVPTLTPTCNKPHTLRDAVTGRNRKKRITRYDGLWLKKLFRGRQCFSILHYTVTYFARAQHYTRANHILFNNIFPWNRPNWQKTKMPVINIIL